MTLTNDSFALQIFDGLVNISLEFSYLMKYSPFDGMAGNILIHTHIPVISKQENCT